MKYESNKKVSLNLFDRVTPPETSVFYKSPDFSDKKLGDMVSYEQTDYDHAKLVIVGCPQDEGVRRNNGRVGAAQAPDKIRAMLYRVSAPVEHKKRLVFDMGNTLVSGSLEDIHQRHEQIISQLLKDKKKVIVLGGGNDISYPDCKALSSVSQSVLAFNIDSHFDVRENKIRNSGTPYRQLLEEEHIKPDNFIELASQSFANSEVYRNYLKTQKVKVFSLEQIRAKSPAAILKSILRANKSQSIFWGFDMDAVRSADAPGVSASYPTGLNAEEIIEMAKVAVSDKRSRIFEISEVNPNYDIDNRTCKLAALLMVQFMKSIY